MKKNNCVVLLCLIILTLAVVMGCAIAVPSVLVTVYQDQSVPQQEHALLFVYNKESVGITYVFKLDGKRVGKGIVRDIPPRKIGLIPPGTHTVKGVMELMDPPTVQQYDITYEFQAGGRYVLFGDLAHRTGLLGSMGTNFMKIVPLDEFRAEWEAMGGRRNQTAEKNDADYKKMVLDYFTDAENVLNAAAQ